MFERVFLPVLCNVINAFLTCFSCVAVSHLTLGPAENYCLSQEYRNLVWFIVLLKKITKNTFTFLLNAVQSLFGLTFTFIILHLPQPVYQRFNLLIKSEELCNC